MMPDDMAELSRRWRRDGFVVVRGLFPPSRAAQLAAQMEAVVEQWRECDHGGGSSHGRTCSSHSDAT
jgi:hypothetical protein